MCKHFVDYILNEPKLILWTKGFKYFYQTLLILSTINHLFARS